MLRQSAALIRRRRVGWPVDIEQGRVARHGPGSGCGSRAGRRARSRCSERRTPAAHGAALRWCRRCAPTRSSPSGCGWSEHCSDRGDAVALGLADEGGRALDAEEGDLVLEVAGHVVRAVVVTQGEALGHVLLDGTEVAQDALAHRLECLEAVAGAGGMVAHALTGAVIDGDKHPGPALVQGHGLGHVGTPHDIHGGGGDGAVVRALLRVADAVRREQTVLAHEPPDPPGRGADARMPQAGADLAVALAMQARAEDLGANVLEQLGIGAGPDRAVACWTG